MKFGFWKILGCVVGGTIIGGLAIDGVAHLVHKAKKSFKKKESK